MIITIITLLSGLSAKFSDPETSYNMYPLLYDYIIFLALALLSHTVELRSYV